MRANIAVGRLPHWAYDHADKDAVIDAENRIFSKDASHYLPLCTRCHYTLDQSDHVKWVLAKVLDTPCRTCGAVPGRLCRSQAGTEYKSLSFQHVRRKNDAPVDTRPLWMIRFEEDRARQRVAVATGRP